MPRSASEIVVDDFNRPYLVEAVGEDNAPEVSTAVKVPRIAGTPNRLHGKGEKGWATFVHSKIVRARGACERCGNGDYRQLQACHIRTRSYSALRVDDRNLICMCASCHRHMTNDPLAFADLVTELYGPERQATLAGILMRHDGKIRWGSMFEALRIRATIEGIDL